MTENKQNPLDELNSFLATNGQGEIYTKMLITAHKEIINNPKLMAFIESFSTFALGRDKVDKVIMRDYLLKLLALLSVERVIKIKDHSQPLDATKL